LDLLKELLLNMADKIPKYREISDAIRSQIQDGRLKAGDQVMTENELCQHYGVSRMTARNALETLAAEGIVRRISGKGTFVNSIRVEKLGGSVTSFSDDIRSAGMEPGSILVEYRTLRGFELPGNIRDDLEVAPDELVHSICRIRTADGLKVALNYTYIPCSILPALDTRMLEGSIYEYFINQYGLEICIGSLTNEAVLPTPEQKQLLGIGDCALLKTSHASYLADGRPLEYTITYYVNSRIVYTRNSLRNERRQQSWQYTGEQ